MLKRRLIWQLYPSFLLIILISVVSVAIYGSQSLRKFHLDHVKRDLNSRAQLIKKQIEHRLKDGNYSELDEFCKESGANSSTRLTVIMLDGQVIAESDKKDPSRMDDHSSRPEFIMALEKGTGHSIRYSNTVKKRMMYFALPIVQDGKVIAVARTSVPVNAIDEALNSNYRKLCLAVLIIAVTIAILSLGISKRITSPVEKMTAVAKKFAAGDLDLRLTVPKATEFADLAIALNEMASQLDHRIDTITEERSKIQAILSSMIEGVLAVDPEGNIVSINDAAAELLDIDTKSLSMNISQVIQNRKLRKYIDNTLKSSKKTKPESSVMNIGNRHLQLYGSSLAEDSPQNSGAVLVIHDITRTCQLEDIRRDFVANVSHELKTPVTSIKGFVETLLDGAISETEEAERFLRIIEKHSDRLNSIIEDLLSLSRLEESEKRSLTFEDSRIEPVLVSAIELSRFKAEKKNIFVELECDSNLVAKINAPLVEQAILNLVVNAIKYSDENSKISITAKRNNATVSIDVSDQGSGIAPEHLERIFERFYVVDKARTRKLGGTGLGLSIVKHIAQVHSGRIDVKSKVGKGTTFTMYFPFD